MKSTGSLGLVFALALSCLGYAGVARAQQAGGSAAGHPKGGASGSGQKVRWSSVGLLSIEEKLPAPALMIVGRVASQQIREIGDAFWHGERNDPKAQTFSVS